MEVKLFSAAEVGKTFGSPPKIQLQWRVGCGRGLGPVIASGGRLQGKMSLKWIPSDFHGHPLPTPSVAPSLAVVGPY